ncbi:MAG: hypothetical protein M3P92_03725, partial [Actinomycetota bacterium]|nr:hypothetical protein [Actinomycetota bacterium]
TRNGTLRNKISRPPDYCDRTIIFFPRSWTPGNPACYLLDNVALLHTPDATVQCDDERAGADVRPQKIARFSVLAQRTSHELNEEGIVGDARAGGHASLQGSGRGAVWGEG